MHDHDKSMNINEQAASTWSIDQPATSVEFQVRHMVVTNVTGTFSKFHGSVEGNPEIPFFSSAQMEIETSSLDTHDRMRDKRLKGADMFNCDKYPSIRFHSTSFEPTENRTFKLVGELSIRSVSREVQLTARIDPPVRGSFSFSLKGKVSSEDFGLRWKSFYDPARILVGSVVSINVNGKFKSSR